MKIPGFKVSLPPDLTPTDLISKCLTTAECQLGVPVMKRPNQELLLLDWLIASHVTYITSSNWLFTYVGRFPFGVFLPLDILFGRLEDSPVSNP